MVVSLKSVYLRLCWCLGKITKSIKTKNNDANGNIKQIKSTSELIGVGERAFTWDEQNRLLAVKDNHGASISHYVYDHTGERTFKSEGGISQANIGGQQIYEVEDIYNYTIYPSGNMVVSPNKDEYTKHYYSNGKKITSRIEKLDNNFEFTTTMSNLASGESITPQTNSYTVFSAGNNQANCSQQLTTALNYYTGPQWSECRAFINSIIAAYPNDPCEAVEILNQYTCEENPPAPVADPTAPEYTPGQISEFDCLVELNILLNELSADTGHRKDNCYTQVEQYVQTHLVLAPLSNACEIFAYISTHFDCIEKEHNGHLDQPSPIEVVDDGYMHPTPASGMQEEEEFDESKRKPIWWYHSDHLGSSSYLTDNFGRPTHYYDQLPFGESMVEHNQSQYYGNQYKFNGKELDQATGMYYYGARYYDPRLSIFISVDPLAEQTFEPYSYVGNNPIMFIDPTGMSREDWEPDKNGNLISEKGDNSKTLADKLEISETEASKMINSQGLKRENYVQTDANVKEGQNLKINDTRQRIANIAEYNIGSESWNFDVSRGNYPENSNKCNVFVGEVTTSAGAGPGKPNVINPGMSKLPFVDKKYGFPLAGQWANSDYSINNWRILGANEKPMRGDIASYSFNYSDASGHVAIVTSSRGFTVGTSGTYNRISKTDFGFNPQRSNGNQIIYRRYIGR